MRMVLFPDSEKGLATASEESGGIRRVSVPEKDLVTASKGVGPMIFRDNGKRTEFAE